MPFFKNFKDNLKAKWARITKHHSSTSNRPSNLTPTPNVATATSVTPNPTTATETATSKSPPTSNIPTLTYSKTVRYQPRPSTSSTGLFVVCHICKKGFFNIDRHLKFSHTDYDEKFYIFSSPSSSDEDESTWI